MVVLTHTIHAFANANSIAQRSPKMIVLMLDACTEFAFDEGAVEGAALKPPLKPPVALNWRRALGVAIDRLGSASQNKARSELAGDA